MRVGSGSGRTRPWPGRRTPAPAASARGPSAGRPTSRVRPDARGVAAADVARLALTTGLAEALAAWGLLPDPGT